MTQSARDVLSDAVKNAMSLGMKPEGSLFAEKLLSALTAAGYLVEAGPIFLEPPANMEKSPLSDMMKQWPYSNAQEKDRSNHLREALKFYADGNEDLGVTAANALAKQEQP